MFFPLVFLSPSPLLWGDLPCLRKEFEVSALILLHTFLTIEEIILAALEWK